MVSRDPVQEKLKASPSLLRFAAPSEGSEEERKASFIEAFRNKAGRSKC
jgi:hypothetical protein